MINNPLLEYLLRRARIECAARLGELDRAIAELEREAAAPPKRWKPRIKFTEDELRRMSEASEDE